jgi:hypothetical protein
LAIGIYIGDRPAEDIRKDVTGFRAKFHNTDPLFFDSSTMPDFTNKSMAQAYDDE